MPHNLTEVSTFTPNVSVPDGADPRTAASIEPAFQALANRTRILSDTTISQSASIASNATSIGVLGQFAEYTVSSTALAPGGTLTLTLVRQVGGFALASNRVQVPAAGTYEAFLCFSSQTSVTGSTFQICNIRSGGVIRARCGEHKSSAAASEGFTGSVATTLVVTVPATDLIDCLYDALSNGNGTVGVLNIDSRLLIRRIS